MNNISDLGARASNAGDEFHELWALRKALLMLKPDSFLYEMTLEGLRSEDETRGEVGSWDGIDCAFYYGNPDARIPNKIEIVQLKHSSANPNQKWTVSRLIKSSSKTSNNSIIRKLADAFQATKRNYTNLVETGALSIQFVSNQPIAEEVSSVFQSQNKIQSPKNSSIQEAILERLKKASGLNEEDFQLFLGLLDFSSCGNESRSVLEEEIVFLISGWTDADALRLKNELLGKIRKKMMPEDRRIPVNCQTILSWMGVSDERSLFPCPSNIKKIDKAVERRLAKLVADEILNGGQYFCIHGDGGCGKSTFIQQLHSKLPVDSEVITFDCYGSGRYLDSDALRHRPRDAFLQLINDLAVSAKIPSMLPNFDNFDFPKAFKKRLLLASEVVKLKNPNARIVVVVDAADNSIVAAEKQAEKESSFIFDFARIGELPNNIAFVVTTRSSRVESLNLPPHFTYHKLEAFDRDETNHYLKTFFDEIDDEWINDFHHLTGGNPRVQGYALEIAKFDKDHALSLLRPNGISLKEIFKNLLDEAAKKSGCDLTEFCKALVHFPRPIPIHHIASVVELSEAQVLEVSSDLSPGLFIENQLISFRDEDFETYLRTKAIGDNARILNLIADRFLETHEKDEYAERYFASALLEANRREQLLDLVKSHLEPTAIKDPLLKLNVKLQRLTTAMKVCLATKDYAEAYYLILLGAEAMNTEEAFHRLLKNNPDLTVRFATDKGSQLFFLGANSYHEHGKYLFHLLAYDSRQKDTISYRHRHVQLNAWLEERNSRLTDELSGQSVRYRESWTFGKREVSAFIESLLRMKTPQEAVDWVAKRSPNLNVFDAALELLYSLIIGGEAEVIEACLDHPFLRSPWRLFVKLPLAYSGKDYEIEQLEEDLLKLYNRGILQTELMEKDSVVDEDSFSFFEMILTACEAFIAWGGASGKLVPVLEKLNNSTLRQCHRLFTSNTEIIDLILRASALISKIKGSEFSIETFLVDQAPGLEKSYSNDIEKRRYNEHKEELKRFISPQIPLYDIRARAILGEVFLSDLDSELLSAVTKFNGNAFHVLSNSFGLPMLSRIAISLSRLLYIPGINKEKLIESVMALFDMYDLIPSKQLVRLLNNFALDHSLHRTIHRITMDQFAKVRERQCAAEEKISVFSDLARFLLGISLDDSEQVFLHATNVASEVNLDGRNSIRILRSLSSNAKDCLCEEQKRKLAVDISNIIRDADLRSEESEHFPWVDAILTLYTLDPAFFFTVIARWHDEKRGYLNDFLSTLINSALSLGTMPISQIVSLLPLLEEIEEGVILGLLERVEQIEDKSQANLLIEDIAKDDLLRFGKGTRSKTVEKIKSLSTDINIEYWTSNLVSTSTYLEKNTRSSVYKTAQQKNRAITLKSKDMLSSITLCSRKGLEATYSEIDTIAQNEGFYDSSTIILEMFREGIEVTDRRSYLDSLSQADLRNVHGNVLLREILGCVKLWTPSLAIESWCKEGLPDTFFNRIESFDYSFDKDLISLILDKTGLNNDQILDRFFRALETKIEQVPIYTIYSLLDFISNYCSPIDSKKIILQYSEHLLTSVPVPKRQQWNLQEVASDLDSVFARFLYTLLGDIDSRVRWRAAHTVRRLARYGEMEILNELPRFYDRIDETGFKNSDFPFYWLSARLWLLISFDRIAFDKPQPMMRFKNWLLKIACNDNFPHILIRQFAKSALNHLVEHSAIAFDSEELRLLNESNKSNIPREKKENVYTTKVVFTTNSAPKKRRFDFDTLDTVPYLFSRAIRVFTDIKEDEFIDVAESWIVDRWSVKNNPYRWDDEPRKSILPRTYTNLMHSSHGTYPIIERYRFYLEQHAMWCATGELIKTRALVPNDGNEIFTFEDLIEESCLSVNPIWISDMHNPKPLEKQFWPSLTAYSDEWLKEVKQEDLLNELGIFNASDFLNVSSHHNTEDHDYRETTYLSSALVSTNTALSLVRALQTINSFWDYRLPTEDDEMEINEGDFKLVGWLVNPEHVVGLEEYDPLRFELAGVGSEPSITTLKKLKLTRRFEKTMRWVNTANEVAFLYYPWGDMESGLVRYPYQTSEILGSSGWRLSINRNFLQDLLCQTGLDLITEVGITRRKKDNAIRPYTEVNTGNYEFNGVFLLRRDGALETANGCIGNWMSSRLRTET